MPMYNFFVKRVHQEKIWQIASTAAAAAAEDHDEVEHVDEQIGELVEPRGFIFVGV